MPKIKVLPSSQFSEQVVPDICNTKKNVTVYTVSTYLPSFLSTYIHVYTHILIHTYVGYTCIHTYTYIFTYLRTYVRTCSILMEAPFTGPLLKNGIVLLKYKSIRVRRSWLDLTGLRQVGWLVSLRSRLNIRS